MSTPDVHKITITKLLEKRNAMCCCKTYEEGLVSSLPCMFILETINCSCYVLVLDSVKTYYSSGSGTKRKLKVRFCSYLENNLLFDSSVIYVLRLVSYTLFI